MKKLLIYTTLLLSSFIGKLNACGFYPYGEDVRFCFTHSLDLKMFEFSEFDYSTHSFYPEFIVNYSDNVNLWFQYCNQKIPKSVIKEAIYKIPFYELENKSTTNAMIQYLYKQNDIETINYLKFAKNCESFNKRYENPWERSETEITYKRYEIIEKAKEKIQKIKNKNLKKRYAFLAIRLAYYNKEYQEIISLFNKYIRNTNTDVIYYWSLYFRTKAEENKGLQSYYAAQVFANSIEKRFTVFRNFDFKIDKNQIFKHAKNNTERANIYALIGIKEHAKGLKHIKRTASLDVENKMLPFLMLREINKLEDWILTPYFSLFNPALSETAKNEKYDAAFSYKAIKQRINKDRIYAKEVLEFLKSLPKNIQQKTIWRVLKIQLQYLTQDYSLVLQEINLLKHKENLQLKIKNQLARTEALCKIALQEQGKARLDEEIKKVILKNKKHKQFVFAIARELEYKGNRVEAALLYAALPTNDNGYYNTGVSWKSKKNKKYSYRDYFYNYFEYINVIYSVEEIERIITNVSLNKDNGDSFSNWKYRLIKKDFSRLYDLAGTMYIRKNKLKKALVFFNKIETAYWDKTAYLWGKVYDDSNGSYWNATKSKKRDFQNPFYKLNYTPRFIKEKEDFELNKKTVTAKLIAYIEKAKTAENKDYYYFLVANCYYNMTFYGNAWMMRRFGMSSYDTEPYPEDEPEFRKGTLAKEYYTLAFKNAKNEKFKALCLKMIGKCEYFEKVNYSNRNLNYSFSEKNDSLLKINKTYIKLKSLNEEYYDDLVGGNCAWFEEYFKPSSEE